MRIKNITLVLALIISLPAISQDFETKNMVKVNLPSFVLKGFSIQYERKLSQRVTAAIGYSKIPTSTLPFQSFIQKQVDDPSVNVADFRLGTSIFTPEVRYYFGKQGAFHGFYLAAYARIGTYNITGPVNFYTTTSGTRTAIFDGKLHTATGGLMIGSSFRLSDKFFLDWWIIGASIGGGNGNLNAVTRLSSAEQNSLQKVLNDLNVPFTSIQSQVNSNGATITTSGSMVGVRGLGLNLGFRF